MDSPILRRLESSLSLPCEGGNLAAWTFTCAPPLYPTTLRANISRIWNQKQNGVESGSKPWHPDGGCGGPSLCFVVVMVYGLFVYLLIAATCKEKGISPPIYSLKGHSDWGWAKPELGATSCFLEIFFPPLYSFLLSSPILLSPLPLPSPPLSSLSLLFFLLFFSFCRATKRKGEREREIFGLLGQSPNGHKSWAWNRLQTGASNCVLLSHMCGTDT